MLYQEEASFYLHRQITEKKNKKKNLRLFYLFSSLKLVLQDKRTSAHSIILVFCFLFCFLQLKDKGKKGTQTHYDLFCGRFCHFATFLITADTRPSEIEMI